MWALPTFPKEPGIWLQILASFGSEGGEEPGKECKTLTTQPLPNTVSESLYFLFSSIQNGSNEEEVPNEWPLRCAH